MTKWISTERAIECVYEAASAELRSTDYCIVKLLSRIRHKIADEQGLEMPDDGDYFDDSGNPMSTQEVVTEAIRFFDRSC